jgi:integrase/recombinase XerD
MKTNNSFGIDFITRISKSDRHSALIFARITVDGDRKEISLKENIKTSDWDSAREIVKGRTENVKCLNAHIDDVRFRIKEKFRMLKEKCCIVTAQTVKEAYLGGHSIQKSKHTLCELTRFHFKIEGEKLKPGTIKNYYATEAYLKKFIKFKFNLSDITLDKINYEFITDFEYYVRINPLKKHDPCTGNGVMKHMERLKKMIRWAIKLQWIEVDLLSNYRLSFKKSKRLKLTFEELTKIEKQEFNTGSLAYIKELFLFSCYTGLAYADVMALKSENFEEDDHGSIWCRIHRQKSDELSRVPVLKTAQLLFEKYRIHPKSVVRQTVFPYVSNQEVNRSLKIIGEVCGITKYMSFHLARHTFASTVTLNNGVPIETVSRMLGHTKISTTQIYSEVDEEKIANDMKGVEPRLAKRKSILLVS